MDQNSNDMIVEAAVVDEHRAEFKRDDLDLIELTGHKPVLERNFSRFALLAFSFMIVDSWSGIIGALATGISSGGTVMLIYGSIGVTFFTLMVALSLAELSGAYPTSGGQYHWTAKLAPEGWGPILSWFCGYFNTIGWCVVSASCNIILGQFLMAMIILCNPGIDYHRWQGFVVYQALNTVFTLLNIFGRTILPMLNQGSFIICLTAFCLVNVTILSSTFPKNSASFVFATFTNNTGWKSSGIAFIVGLTNPAFAYGGLDGAIHMTEEMKDARRNIPFILIATVIIGCFTMMVTAISICFCIIDLDAVTSTPTGVPILEIFYQATRNRGASVFLLSIMFYLTCWAVISSQQTSNRLIWAFARDEALPFSSSFKKIHPKLKVPVNAAILCWAVMAILGCVYVGSSTAFNALVGCNVLLANISFAFPISLLLFGRRKHMNPSSFPLGHVKGRIINGLALLWIIFMVIFFNFPFVQPVSAGTMNYSCVIIGSIVIISSGWWIIRGHKTYTGPKGEAGLLLIGEEKEPTIVDLTEQTKS